MPAALAFTAASAPIALPGIKLAGSANGQNSAGWTYANGTPGAADTIANAEFLKGLPTVSRIRTFFATSYATQLELDQAMAAIGLMFSSNGGDLIRLITAAPGVPTGTMTTAAATGSIRCSIGHSIDN